MSSTSTSPRARVAEWHAEPRRSTVGFAAEHHHGTFGAFDARLRVHGDRLELTCDIAVASLTTVGPHAAGRLLEDLDAARFPRILFASTSVRRAEDRVDVHGDLTIRGLTRAVRADGRLHDLGPRRLRLALEAVFDRREFGFPVGDEVSATADLELAPCAPGPLRGPLEG